VQIKNTGTRFDTISTNFAANNTSHSRIIKTRQVDAQVYQESFFDVHSIWCRACRNVYGFRYLGTSSILTMNVRPSRIGGAISATKRELLLHTLVLGKQIVYLLNVYPPAEYTCVTRVLLKRKSI